jgi:hypothetical protein
MTLTNNDVGFLQQLKRTAEVNRQKGSVKKLVTSKGFLSEDLLKLLDIKDTNNGAWLFNVYVEFEVKFKEQDAEEWQQ